MRRARPGLALAIAVVALAGCAAVTEPVVAPKPEPEKPRAAPKPPAPPPPVATVTPTPRPVPPPPAPPPPPPPVAKPDEVEILLADFERVRRLPAAEIVREQEAARQAFNQSRTDAARVRLAMTLAVPGHAGAEEVRALELLEPLVRNPVTNLHKLAFLLTAYIQEQRRLVMQAQGLQYSVQGLQQNVQALQQKLDALRTLERSLTEREPPRRRPGP